MECVGIHNPLQFATGFLGFMGFVAFVAGFLRDKKRQEQSAYLEKVLTQNMEIIDYICSPESKLNEHQKTEIINILSS